MKFTEDMANRIFDVFATEGNHKKTYIDSARDEFVHSAVVDGISSYWYQTECGSSIKVYFNEFNNRVYIWPESLNPIHEKNLRQNANSALKAMGFDLQDIHLT